MDRDRCYGRSYGGQRRKPWTSRSRICRRSSCDRADRRTSCTDGAAGPVEVLVSTPPPTSGAWLEANHDTASEAWIGYYRKGVPKTSQTYDEAVEQALCFGWIDGRPDRVDDEVTTNRFTPRRKGS